MKVIGYAYPSSPLAAKLRRGGTGTFYVADVTDHDALLAKKHVAVSTYSAAVKMCEGHEMSRWTLRDPDKLACEMQACIPLCSDGRGPGQTGKPWKTL